MKAQWEHTALPLPHVSTLTQIAPVWGGNKAARRGVKNTPTPWNKDYTAWVSDQNSREHGL